MLAHDEAPSFQDVADLLDRAAIVSRATMVAEGARIERIRSRNVGFLVQLTDGDAMYVKYLHPRSGELGVGKERRVISDLSLGESTSLHKSLPDIMWQSENMDVLVYRALMDEVAMSDHIRRGRPSQGLAKDLGAVLAELHRMPTPPYQAQTPHGFRVHCPMLAELPSMSAAQLHLVRLIQGSDQLLSKLDHAVASWRTDSFVHADLKFENLLVRRRRDGRSHGVRVLDWEDAGAGDARWDVGTVLGAYLVAWLTSIPHIRAESVASLSSPARIQREVLLPSIRGFWDVYARRRQLGRDDADEFLTAAVRFAGVRLVQAASEGTAASPLTAGHLFLLQVGANMLARPWDASTRLLGLQVGSDA